MQQFTFDALKEQAIDIEQFTSVSMVENDLASVGTKLSNIGEIGIGVDYSNNTLNTEMQNKFPLVDWLLNTTQSRKIKAQYNSGSLTVRRHDDGKLYFTHPWVVGTTLPTDTNGECCWSALDIKKAGGESTFSLLCLKDCDSVLEELVWSKKRFGSNDLTGYFARQGETVKEARVRMAKLSMAFFTAYNIVNGVSTAGTSVLKPFHGLLEVMESNEVLHMSGQNILSAFDQLACRYAVAGDGDIVYAVHPLTYQAIVQAVKPSKFTGELPTNWTKNGDTLTFLGHPFIQDKTVPVDVTKGTGEIWALDGDSLGILLGTTLVPTDKDFMRKTFADNNKPDDGCGTDCTFYYNFGGVFNTNPYRMAVITDVPLSANCLGSALDGLDNLIKPETIVPMETI